MYELAFTDEAYITPDSEQQTSQPEAALYFSGVPLEKHFAKCLPIPDSMRQKIDDQNNSISGREISRRENIYLSKLVDQYLGLHPEIELNVQDDNKLAKCIEVAYGVVSSGTGEHDDSFNFDNVTEQISLDNPPNTKCRIYNELFKHVFPVVAEKIDPSLVQMHDLLNTSAEVSADLAQGSYAPTLDNKKIISHQFLTLLSCTEDGFIYTPIDPYHVGDKTRVLEDIDFSLHRTPDSVKEIIKMVNNDPFSFTPLDYVRSAFYSEHLGRLKTLEEKASMAIIITNEIYPIFLRSVSMVKKQKQEVIDHHKYVGQHYLRDRKLWNKDYIVENYAKELRPRSETNKKHENLEKKMVDQVTSTINDLESAILTDKKDIMSLSLLTELVDNCGRQSVPIGIETWQKINAFLEIELLSNQEFQKYMLEEQTNNISNMGLRYNKKTAIRIFRGRFLRYHNTRTPLFVSVTEKDKTEIPDDDNKEYQRFRANIIAIATKAEIQDIRESFPKEDYAEGSKAWYFKKYLEHRVKN